jgi:cyclase
MWYKEKTSIYDIAKQLRQDMTPAEKMLWERLRNNQLGVKFRRQSAFIFGVYRYIVDFYCSEHKLIIEIDGNVHNLKEIKNYDEFREDIFIDSGYKVIRFDNNEILNNTKRVLNKINLIIKKLKN